MSRRCRRVAFTGVHEADSRRKPAPRANERAAAGRGGGAPRHVNNADAADGSILATRRHGPDAPRAHRERAHTNSNIRFAARSAVICPGPSNSGETSTMSPPVRERPPRPRTDAERRGWSARRPWACPSPARTPDRPSRCRKSCRPVRSPRGGLFPTTHAIPRSLTYSMSIMVMPCSRWKSKSSSRRTLGRGCRPARPAPVSRSPPRSRAGTACRESTCRRSIRPTCRCARRTGRAPTVPLRQRAQHGERHPVVAADDDRPRAGIGDGADARLDGLVAFLDADRRRVDVAASATLRRSNGATF